MSHDGGHVGANSREGSQEHVLPIGDTLEKSAATVALSHLEAAEGVGQPCQHGTEDTLVLWVGVLVQPVLWP